ncbi:phosphohydrolase [Synergistales bacterium]|nr:phosphohydrolase [Synergistales bacterium]
MADQKGKRRITTSEVKKLQKDATFYVLGVVTRFVQRKDKNDNPFWEIALMDNEGAIDGKVWGNSEWWNINGSSQRKMNPTSDEELKKLEGKTVGIQGKIVEFRDQNQCNFSAVYYVDQEKYPPHDFVRKSPFEPDVLINSLFSFIEECKEPMRGFLKYVFIEKNLRKDFIVWPAAVSMHHAYVGGLLEHSVLVTRSALSIARGYTPDISNLNIDLDLVIAGALLHDIGKLEAYKLSPAPNMTTLGSTVDHIVCGYHTLMKLLAEYGKLDERTAMALGHIIVSHHGSREFGSPVLPETPEAFIVAAADDLDFKLFVWRDQVSQLDGDKEFSEFLAPLQRRFWKSHDVLKKSPPVSADPDREFANAGIASAFAAAQKDAL